MGARTEPSAGGALPASRSGLAQQGATIGSGEGGLADTARPDEKEGMGLAAALECASEQAFGIGVADDLFEGG
ncbi:MAG: hypothetical protein AMXMBFR61_09080 [Fimbriimonadales bacterium]